MKWTDDFALTIGKKYSFNYGCFTDDNGLVAMSKMRADELRCNGFVENMTTEEKKNMLYGLCSKHPTCADCPLGNEDGDCQYLISDPEQAEKAYSIAFPEAEEKSGIQEAVEKIQECGIKDSGERRQFETGAVRDIQEGKGRCDLLPLDVIARIYGAKTRHFGRSLVFDSIAEYVRTGDATLLYNALGHFMLDDMPFCDRNWSTMWLEVAKHFEEGCKKYGENNWQKGIPSHCYVDSAVRHYLKWARGDKDEPHDRAFVWNILCCIWTCIHKPELNDYTKNTNDETK